MFQSTRPRRARHAKAMVDSGKMMFQSTRPRRARPLDDIVSVDIHLFQSTRPRRARRASGKVDANARRFNPRARVGRDAETMPGVTVTECFNPRARVGRDFRSFTREGTVSLFQSTRPRRARPFDAHKLVLQLVFQSTRPRRARRYAYKQP